MTQLEALVLAILLLFAILILGALWWASHRREQRAQASFFEPGLERAEVEFRLLSRQQQGTYVPGECRWEQMASLATLSVGDDRRVLDYRSSGGVYLRRAGFMVQVSWVLVPLQRRWSLLPRVRVSLPLNFKLNALHALPITPIVDYWFMSTSAFELWSRGRDAERDRNPSIPLTPHEARAFEPLAALACNICFVSSTPANYLTGILPREIALDLHVWAAPRHGQDSEQPFMRGRPCWREDFRPEGLEELVTLAVAFAATATIAPTRPAA